MGREPFQRIDDQASECVSFLGEICAIPAIGPENQGTGEMAKYRIVKDRVLALNPDQVEEIHAPDDRVPDGVRPNLVALFGGRDSSRTLWILSHLDVVPPGELGLWDSDPFQPKVENGFLVGRGVEDNGQAVAASIFAVKAVRETCGFALNVGLALVSDEESGSLYGLDYVLRNRMDLFREQDLIVVPDAGNKDGDHIEVAEKHLLHVRFRVKGKQGHASRPDLSVNTLRAASHLIVRLDESLATRFAGEDRFFNPACSTFEPTKKEANVPNINTIPGEDVLYFDCRVLPDIPLGSVLEEMESVSSSVESAFGVRVALEEVLKFEAPEPTPADSPVVIALARAVQEVYGVQPRPTGIGGQTVAAFFRKRGLRAAVWEKILGYAHAPNERISIDNLTGNAKVFARMMV
ncbi:MAG: succinyl-diaminopimelate desuccinylase [Thermodesulfobacteriota bacterium]|nr:succinyl-diaminopimelate desuccinylase [Thermodesulfobacteriota bacterium]